MKCLIPLICMFIFLACNRSPEKHLINELKKHLDTQKTTAVKPDTLKDQKVIKMIESLPEVVEEKKIFYEKTKRHISVEMENDPKKDGYYTIGIVEDMVNHDFHLWYFQVDARTYGISYVDFGPDTLIPYKNWSDYLKRKRINSKR